MKIKIGVLSDTHLGQVTDKLVDIYDKYLSDKDMILHAGDIVSPEVIHFLGRKGNFHGVYGNMDPLDARKLLPEKKLIESGPFRLGLIHGWGSSEGLEERILTRFQDVDIIVYGHSHQAVSHFRDGILFFNPGTATGYSNEGIHSIGILEIDDAIHSEIIRLGF